MPDLQSFTLLEALEILGGKPESSELKRLAEFYPTYRLPHRRAFLEDFFNNLTEEQILKHKFEIKSINESYLTKQQKGSHAKWPRHKSRGLVLRILYLRFMIDENKSSSEAINILTYRYGSKVAKDPKNSIRVLLRRRAINLP